MAMRSRDLTLDLEDKRLTILTWSSDPIAYTLENKTIRTTFDNTVQDLKEVISQRSYQEGGQINPLALKLFYRYGELRSSDPLSTVLADEIEQLHSSSEPVRIRVEIDTSQLLAKEVKPCLFNVNLRTSSGKVVRLSESMKTTVESLKYTLVDDLHLHNGLSDITGLEFNGGVDVCARNGNTLGDLLELDTVPFGDLNFFVTLASDTKIRLSSPLDSVVDILRTSYMSVNLDTTIFTVKKYILDQYSGRNPNVTTDDIKIIYFGRVLTDDIRIRNITSPSTADTTLVLHFSLHEPEDTGPSNGFWSDLKNGKLFEFYPKEPNPYFATESQRIERLRDQFRNSGQADEPTTSRTSEGIFVRDYTPLTSRPSQTNQHDDQPIADDEGHRQTDADEVVEQVIEEEEAEQTSTEHATEQPTEQPTEQTENSTRPPTTTRPVSNRSVFEAILEERNGVTRSRLTGNVYDEVERNGEIIHVDQLETHSVIYRITVHTAEGPQSVLLSSSQVMINDLVPEPYIMISPSGMAKLNQLPIDIIPPQQHRIDRLPTIAAEQHHHQQAQPNGDAADAAIIDEAILPIRREEVLFELRLNLDDLRLDTLINFLSHSMRYLFVYFLFVQPMFTGYGLYAAMVALFAWAVFSYATGDAVGVIARGAGRLVHRVFELDGLNLQAGTRDTVKRLLAFGTRTHGLGQFQRAIRGSLVDFVLFFTSLSPALHEMCMGLLRELLEERRQENEALLARLEELRGDDGDDAALNHIDVHLHQD